MTKFNKTRLRPAVSSPVITTSTASGTTHQGGPGYARDTRSELFLLAVANMVSEDTFYEKAGTRDDRYTALIHQATVADPEWTAALLRWLRTEANMRSAAIVGAAEFVKARLAAGESGLSRQVISSVLLRADEPGELLGYWTTKHGRAIPKPVKRGVADAVIRLYNERSLLKWDSDARGFRFADVIDLVHPVTSGWRGELFGYALDRRHGHDEGPPASLSVLTAHRALMAVPLEQRRAVLDRDDAAVVLNDAGMTWESLAGWLQGPMDRLAWESVIPAMGYMARLRNLRNFDEAGVCDEVAGDVADYLADPGQVARSRQLPMRFLSAYKAAPSLRWAYPLEQALNASLANVPALPGRTLILVDMSGSMMTPLSARSKLLRAEAAVMFGTALALRCEQADLVQFGTSSAPVGFTRGESVLRVIGRFQGMGGTHTAEAVRRHLRPDHARVVIVTDEQAGGGWYGEDPAAQVSDRVPVYTWNLAGYRFGHGPSGSGNRHTFGGLTDQAFGMIPLLEAGQSATWPWLSR